jgi:hypothetical protein
MAEASALSLPARSMVVIIRAAWMHAPASPE